MYYAYILETSRKAKAARHVYDFLYKHRKEELLPSQVVAGFPIRDGIRVTQTDKNRILNLRFHDEHMSPYFKTNMSLFHLLMIDETADIWAYRGENGWMFLFEGIQEAPKPFGAHGYDMR
jgi:hypothetical protein